MPARGRSRKRRSAASKPPARIVLRQRPRDGVGALAAGVLHDPAHRRLERGVKSRDPHGFVVVSGIDGAERPRRLHQGHAAAGHHALGRRRAGRVQRVGRALLAGAQLGLGRAAEAQVGDGGAEAGEALLQLLAVEAQVLLGLRLAAQHVAALLDLPRVAGAVDDRGAVAGDVHPLRSAHHRGLQVFQLVAKLVGDDLPAGHDREVFQHQLAPAPEAGRLDRGDAEPALLLVDDQRRQCLAHHVLCDDEQRVRRLREGPEGRLDRAHAGDRLLVHEHVGVLQHHRHVARVGDEGGRDIARVEAHALVDRELRLDALRFLDGHDPVGADLADGVGQVAGDLVVAARREPGHALKAVLCGKGAGLRVQRLGDRSEPAFHPPLDAHGVRAGGGGAVPLVHERGREHHRGGGAVADLVRHLRAHVADQAAAHVLEAVRKIDVAGDGVAVGRDPRLGVAALDQHCAPAGAEGSADDAAHDLRAPQQPGPGLESDADALRPRNAADHHGVRPRRGQPLTRTLEGASSRRLSLRSRSGSPRGRPRAAPSRGCLASRSAGRWRRPPPERGLSS